jgi:hypothetical protein
MTAPNPRDALNQIVTMFGYDHTCVTEVRLTQYGATVTYMVAKPAGGFTVQMDGFLFGDLPPQPSVIPNVLPLDGEGTLNLS